MRKLTEKIYKELLFRNNVLLIGLADSGKTYYALNELVPFLKNKKLNTVYFSNCNDFLNTPRNNTAFHRDTVVLKNPYL